MARTKQTARRPSGATAPGRAELKLATRKARVDRESRRQLVIPAAARPELKGLFDQMCKALPRCKVSRVRRLMLWLLQEACGRNLHKFRAAFPAYLAAASAQPGPPTASYKALKRELRGRVAAAERDDLRKRGVIVTKSREAVQAEALAEEAQRACKGGFSANH